MKLMIKWKELKGKIGIVKMVEGKVEFKRIELFSTILKLLSTKYTQNYDTLRVVHCYISF